MGRVSRRRRTTRRKSEAYGKARKKDPVDGRPAMIKQKPFLLFFGFGWRDIGSLEDLCAVCQSFCFPVVCVDLIFHPCHGIRALGCRGFGWRYVFVAFSSSMIPFPVPLHEIDLLRARDTKI